MSAANLDNLIKYVMQQFFVSIMVMPIFKKNTGCQKSAYHKKKLVSSHSIKGLHMEENAITKPPIKI